METNPKIICTYLQSLQLFGYSQTLGDLLTIEIWKGRTGENQKSIARTILGMFENYLTLLQALYYCAPKITSYYRYISNTAEIKTGRPLPRYKRLLSLGSTMDSTAEPPSSRRDLAGTMRLGLVFQQWSRYTVAKSHVFKQQTMKLTWCSMTIFHIVYKKWYRPL